MGEQSIQIEHETIGVSEQRNLIEMARTLGRAMTHDEYTSIMLIYKGIIDKLVVEAERQGIDI